MEAAAPPAGLPSGGTPPVCWKADYASEGEATVWVCGYRVNGTAFDALQRAVTGADTVKFQQGRYLVEVHWTAVSQAGVTTLVRAIQRGLPLQ